MMYTPYEFQEDAILFGLNGNVIIGDKCGLGKTLIAIEIYKRWRRHIPGPCLYITTKAGKAQVVGEIQEQDPGILIYVDDCTDVDKNTICYVVTHLEHLPKTVVDLKKIYWSCYIMDEAHKIANRKTKRTKNSKMIISRKNIAMSATITSKNETIVVDGKVYRVPHPAQLFSVMQWLNEDKYRGFFKFRSKWLELEKHPWLSHLEEKGIKDPESYKKFLDKVWISRKKRDVAQWLPSITFVNVPIEMQPRQKRAYKKFVEEAEKDIIVNVEDLTSQAVLNVLARYLIYQKIAEYPGLASETLGGGAKIEWLHDFLEANPDESVLIISKFARTAEVVHQQIDGSQCITGKLNNYNAESKPQIVVASIQAVAGVYDMPWIDNVIYLGFHWSATIMEQSRDRVDRINIVDPKTIYYLVAQGTLDEIMLNAFLKNSSVMIALEEAQTHFKEVLL